MLIWIVQGTVKIGRNITVSRVFSTTILSLRNQSLHDIGLT
jgi:hypothetical protein